MGQAVPDRPEVGSRQVLEIRPFFEMEDFAKVVSPEFARAGSRRFAKAPPEWERRCRRATHRRGRSGGSSRRGSSPRSPDWSGTSGWPRSSRRTRSSRRSSSGRPPACRRTSPAPGCMTTARHRAIDLIRREQNPGREVRGAGARVTRRAGRRTGSSTTVGDDLLVAGVHRLPPGAAARVADRADPAAVRRADHRRDRPRLPGAVARRSGSGSRAPSARWPRRTSRSRCRRPTSCRARLPSVLEVVYLIFTEGYAATSGDAGCVGTWPTRRCGWAACSPGCCRASPRCTAWSR